MFDKCHAKRRYIPGRVSLNLPVVRRCLTVFAVVEIVITVTTSLSIIGGAMVAIEIRYDRKVKQVMECSKK